MVAVKICGVTSLKDAELCVEAGADAIGLNFHAGSPRRVDPEAAREIVGAVAGRVLTVAVFVDASYEEITAIKRRTGVACVQLHGDEAPELLARFLPHAYKAIGVQDEGALVLARRFGGKHILLDAFVPGQPGGTGRSFRWELAVPITRERLVTLAGGLRPENVADAVRQVAPFCVDVASGVELAPGRKDSGKVRDFIRAAKAALPTPSAPS